MFTHIVLLQPKPETTTDEITAALAQVHALQSAIPGISAITSGENVSANHAQYPYGFVITLHDAADFATVAAHPAYMAVGATLQRVCQESIDFDLDQPQTEGPNLLDALKAAYHAFVAGWQKAGEKTAEDSSEYV